MHILYYSYNILYRASFGQDSVIVWRNHQRCYLPDAIEEAPHLPPWILTRALSSSVLSPASHPQLSRPSESKSQLLDLNFNLGATTISVTSATGYLSTTRTAFAEHSHGTPSAHSSSCSNTVEAHGIAATEIRPRVSITNSRTGQELPQLAIIHRQTDNHLPVILSFFQSSCFSASRGLSVPPSSMIPQACLSYIDSLVLT